MTEEEKETDGRLDAIIEKLDAMIQLLETIVRAKRRETNRHAEFIEWAKEKKFVKTSEITNKYNVRKPTALRWLRELASIGFTVKIRHGRQGESTAVKSEI